MTSYRTPEKLSPISKRIAQVAPTSLTRRDVAEFFSLGSLSTLDETIRKHKLKVPSEHLDMGQLKIGLFTPEDLEVLRPYFEERRYLTRAEAGKPGAPKRWTAAQRKERMRLRQQKIYHLRRAKALGRTKAATEHRAIAKAAQKALDEMPTRQQKAKERADGRRSK